MSKKINIDFDILDTHNPFFMSVVDQSNWATLKNNVATIEVTLPGYSEPGSNYFDKNSINTLNVFNLGIICAEDCVDPEYEAIPDGIYTITVKSSCGKYTTTKKFLRTTTLELELDKVIIANITCDKNADGTVEDWITEVEFDIRAAEAHLRYDNTNEANQLFDKACELVERLQDCKLY